MKFRTSNVTVKGTKPTASRVEASPPRIRATNVSSIERKYGVILEKADLQYFGKCILKYIREEALKDASKTGQVPTSAEFLDSFTYQVKDNTIEVSSSWPWIDLIIHGTDGPYRMKWLTQEKGVYKVPLRGKHGEVLIRTAPLKTDKAWIHPGIVRHTFVERAFRKARTACFDKILEKNMSRIISNVLK